MYRNDNDFEYEKARQRQDALQSATAARDAAAVALCEANRAMATEDSWKHTHECNVAYDKARAALSRLKGEA